MTSALIALALGLQVVPRVAYVGKDSSVAGSKAAVFVVGLDGSNLQRVASPAKEPFAVLWAGKGRLVWLCDPAADEAEVWTCVWPGGKPSLAGKLSVASWWQSRPGLPFLGVGSRGMLAQGWMKVTEDGQIEACPAPHTIYEASLPITTQDAKYALTAESEEDGTVLSLSLHDGVGTFPLKYAGGFQSIQYDPKTDRAFVKTSSKKPAGSYLYSVDWGGHRLIPRVSGYSVIDFWPDRDDTAYCPSATTIAVGKKKVTVSPLYVGNVRTGQFKKVVGGTMLVTAASIQGP